jgi:hypothetical protein
MQSVPSQPMPGLDGPMPLILLTPTANKLYQFVRKGSMSAPAEALNRFWQMLRDKSRVRIEHPDLPEELRDAAGEAMGALWQRAQALADAHLEAAHGETQAVLIEARAATETAQARADAVTQTLASTEAELALSQARVQQLEQDLAREQGARAALERQATEAAEQRRELQRALEGRGGGSRSNSTSNAQRRDQRTRGIRPIYVGRCWTSIASDRPSRDCRRNWSRPDGPPRNRRSNTGLSYANSTTSWPRCVRSSARQKPH